MRIRLRTLATLASLSLITACSHNGYAGPVLPQMRTAPAPVTNDPQIAVLAQDVFAAPPACKGQTTAPTHSTDSEKLLTTGGKLCIPAFGGFGGSVSYPPANPSVGITLISSTTNYNGQLPSLHSGTPIFYLQLAIAAGTNFGSNVTAGGGLTSAKIKPGSSYTVYGQAKISGFTFNFTPCYTVATKGKYGGVIGGVGTLLKGQSVPGAATGVIEIYSGKSAAGKC